MRSNVVLTLFSKNSIIDVEFKKPNLPRSMTTWDYDPPDRSSRNSTLATSTCPIISVSSTWQGQCLCFKQGFWHSSVDICNTPKWGDDSDSLTTTCTYQELLKLLALPCLLQTFAACCMQQRRPISQHPFRAGRSSRSSKFGRRNFAHESAHPILWISAIFMDPGRPIFCQRHLKLQSH